MNAERHAAVDLDRATDQLVDELCQRFSALHAVVDSSLSEVGPSVQHIRWRAVVLIDRLTQADARLTAIDLARTLWPPQPGPHVPTSWWATPLGRLIATALDGRSPAAVGPGDRARRR